MQMVDMFKCHTSHPVFPGHQLSLGRLRKGRRNHNSQGTFDNKKILIKTILASNSQNLHNRICQWHEIENLVLTPRTAEDEEQIDLDPDQLTLISQKTAERATSSRRLVATAHRESRNTDSESFRRGIICHSCGKWTVPHYR